MRWRVHLEAGKLSRRVLSLCVLSISRSVSTPFCWSFFSFWLFLSCEITADLLLFFFWFYMNREVRLWACFNGIGCYQTLRFLLFVSLPWNIWKNIVRKYWIQNNKTELKEFISVPNCSCAESFFSVFSSFTSGESHGWKLQHTPLSMSWKRRPCDYQWALVKNCLIWPALHLLSSSHIYSSCFKSPNVSRSDNNL